MHLNSPPAILLVSWLSKYHISWGKPADLKPRRQTWATLPFVDEDHSQHQRSSTDADDKEHRWLSDTCEEQKPQPSVGLMQPYLPPAARGFTKHFLTAAQRRSAGGTSGSCWRETEQTEVRTQTAAVPVWPLGSHLCCSSRPPPLWLFPGILLGRAVSSLHTSTRRCPVRTRDWWRCWSCSWTPPERTAPFSSPTIASTRSPHRWRCFLYRRRALTPPLPAESDDHMWQLLQPPF